MRCSTATGLMLAAVTIGEVVAGPTHAHMHKHMRNKKDVDWDALDWNAMGIDWSSAWAAGQKTAVPTVAPTTAAPAPAATTAANSPAVEIQQANSQPTTTTAATVAPTPDSSSGELFNNVVGVSNGRTSFGGSTGAVGSVGDFYVGNTGSPYGSNIIKVGSAAGYDFTNTFVNSQSVGITVNIWQKVGPDMQPLSGSALAPKQTTLTFYLAPGAEQVVAFQANTQVGWAQSCSETSVSGSFSTTWGEANFVPSGSGYDVSAIMNPNNNNYAMTITSSEASGCTSSRTENFWLTATDPVGDSNGSCFIAQSTATLKTVMGGTI